MFGRKRRNFYILCVTLIGITAILGGTFFFFHKKDARIHKEAQTHIDNIFSLSGKLSAEEKQVFISETQALVKLLEPHFKNGDQSLPFISDEELERIQKHTMALAQENPDLAIHSHGPGEPHQHAFETDHGKNHAWFSEELANINATIEKVKASNASESAKEALLSVLEHRRDSIMNYEKDTADIEAKLREFIQQDPTITGAERNNETGEITPLYPNMLRVEIRQYTHPDGTVGEWYVPKASRSSDPEVAKLLNAYREAFDTLKPWEMPPLPEHEDLRVTIKYGANYRKENAEENTEESLQTSEQFTEHIETSEDTSTEITSAYPEPHITAEEVEEWQGALQEISDSTDIEIEAIRDLFEEAIGIPMDRFLEMTDAEIEAEFNKYFSPSEADLEKQLMPGAPMDLSIEENFRAELRSQFSQKRYNQAMQTLERYGPEEGIRRLKDVDPEISTHFERMIQQQKEE